MKKFTIQVLYSDCSVFFYIFVNFLFFKGFHFKIPFLIFISLKIIKKNLILPNYIYSYKFACRKQTHQFKSMNKFPNTLTYYVGYEEREQKHKLVSAM